MHIVDKYNSFLISKMRYIYAPDGMLAGETVQLHINQHPTDLITGMGNGSFMSGLRNLMVLGATLKHSWTNMAIMTGSYTVGVAATYEIIFEPGYNFLMLGLIYKNSASSTGTITDFKVHGVPLGNIGYVVGGSTAAANNLASEIAMMDNVDWLWEIPAGKQFSISGTAVNADLVTITVYGWNLDLYRVAMGI